MTEEEADVLLHVPQRRVQTAVRHRDAGVEIEPAFLHLPLRDGVAVRTVSHEVIGSVIEKCPAHAERTQDVLVDVGLPGFARDLLDDPAQVDDSGVRVAVLRARGPLHLGLGQHARRDRGNNALAQLADDHELQARIGLQQGRIGLDQLFGGLLTIDQDMVEDVFTQKLNHLF